MFNLMAFINMFLSYLLVFGIAVVLVIAAVLIGIRLRKKKDAKAALLAEEAAATEESGTGN